MIGIRTYFGYFKLFFVESIIAQMIHEENAIIIVVDDMKCFVFQVATGEGGPIIQQFIDEQGNIIEGQIISTETAMFQEEEAGTTEVDGETAVIEGQQIFEGQEAEVIHIKHEDLQPGDSLLKPR